nr:AEC family transporter [Paraoerskovia sediminicola]
MDPPARGPFVLATVSKSVVHPALVWAVGTAAGLEGTALTAVVATAALPTAQNVVVYATRYRCAVGLASRVCLVTTILAAPVLVLVAGVLGS